jgi:hypothetical protein
VVPKKKKTQTADILPFLINSEPDEFQLGALQQTLFRVFGNVESSLVSTDKGHCKLIRALKDFAHCSIEEEILCGIDCRKIVLIMHTQRGSFSSR